MIFDVDYNRFVAIMLPSSLRKPLVFGLLRAAAVALQSLYEDFCEARDEHNFRLTHNGQVCYLQAALNAKFKSSIGTILILSTVYDGEWLYAVTEDGTGITQVISESNDDDEQDVPLVYSATTLNSAQNEFIVSVPSDLYDSTLDAIKAFVNQYKLVSKRAIYVAQG